MWQRTLPVADQNRGYQWLGLDAAHQVQAEIKSDAASIPLRSESVSAVVAWQVFEYLERPENAIAEAARVLETGGTFCGSVSFLEPVHGRTYFNMSPLILEKLLAQHGFADIEIKPGLNGFALMLWTWLRRSAIPFADRLAIPIAFVLLGIAGGGAILCQLAGRATGFRQRSPDGVACPKSHRSNLPAT